MFDIRNSLLGSLVKPLFGFLTLMFTGGMGLSPIFGVAKQILVQLACLGLIAGGTSMSLAIGTLCLVAVHVVLQLAVLSFYVGSQFGGARSAEPRDVAQASLLACVVVSAVATLLVLPIASANGFWLACVAFVMSVLFGAANDVVAGLSTIEYLARQSRRPSDVAAPEANG